MTTTETVDARKSRLDLKDARRLLLDTDDLYAARGKKVEHIDLRQGLPDEETLQRLLMGPTGNLRAPTARIGRTVLVGFDEETYRKATR